jgi:hypothetical protein
MFKKQDWFTIGGMVNQETPHQLHNLTSIKDQDIK